MMRALSAAWPNVRARLRRAAVRLSSCEPDRDRMEAKVARLEAKLRAARARQAAAAGELLRDGWQLSRERIAELRAIHDGLEVEELPATLRRVRRDHAQHLERMWRVARRVGREWRMVPAAGAPPC